MVSNKQRHAAPGCCCCIREGLDAWGPVLTPGWCGVLHTGCRRPVDAWAGPWSHSSSQWNAYVESVKKEVYYVSINALGYQWLLLRSVQLRGHLSLPTAWHKERRALYLWHLRFCPLVARL